MPIAGSVAIGRRWLLPRKGSGSAWQPVMCCAKRSANGSWDWPRAGVVAQPARRRLWNGRWTSSWRWVTPTEYESHVLGNLSTLYLMQGDPGRALALARRALARCDEANLPFNRRLALGDMGAAALASGDTGSARRWLEESLAIGRQISDRTQEILCLGHLGWLAVQEGHAPEAAERLSAALALAEGIDSRAEQSWLQAGLAQAQRLAGNADLALAYARRALELTQAHGRPYDEQLAERVLVELGWMRGSKPAA